MKTRSLILLGTFILLILGALQACNKKDNPAAPPSGGTTEPTSTFTNCVNGSGTPCTAVPTSTRTPTSTHTPSATFTATTPGANTYTHTLTRTPTQTWTITLSFTPTRTPTVTATFTNTSTPYVGSGIQGTITSNVGSASSLNPLYVYVSDRTDLNSQGYAATIISGGAYSISPMPVDTYYMIVWRDANSDAGFRDSPRLGDYFQLYNGDGTLPAVDGINVTAGSMTTVNMTLDTTYQFKGIYGSANYIGDETVNGDNKIRVACYTDPTYMTPDPGVIGMDGVTVSGGRYDYITTYNGTLYQILYIDQNGDWQISANEPFVALGAFTPGTSTIRNVTFGDAVTGDGSLENWWNNITASYRFAGVLQYSGSLGTVSATNPMILAVWLDPNLDSEPVAQYVFESGNQGGYLFNPPVTGPFYAIAFMMANGLTNDGPSIGDPYYVLDTGCSLPPTAMMVSTPTALDININDTCRLPGIYGAAYYSGSATIVSDSNRICTAAYADPLYQTRVGFVEDVRANGYRYDLMCPGASGVTLYQLAWLDPNGNRMLDDGERYAAQGPFVAGIITTRDIYVGDDYLWTGRFLQGKVTYSGSLGSVSATNYLLAHLECSSDFSTDCSPWEDRDGYIPTNGGYFHIPVPITQSPVYAAFVYNNAGTSMIEGPHVGDPIEVYNNQYTFNGTAIPVTGPTQLPDVTLDDTARVPGVRGTANYTGTGTVNETTPILVQAYSDSGRTTLLQKAGRAVVNGGRYDIQLFGVPNGTTVYLRSFYDVDGDRSISTGDKWNDAGSSTVDYGAASVVINFSGTNTY